MVVSSELPVPPEIDVNQDDALGVKDNIIILSAVVGVVIAFLVLTSVLVFRRGDLQPLKIRSSKLLFVSILANLFIVIQIYVVQLANELCINSKDNFDTLTSHCKYFSLEVIGLLFGFLIISTCEPLTFVSQVLRAIRLRRIIDAQQSYFNEQTRPTELIARFQEKRLMRIMMIAVAIVTLLYIAAGVGLYFANHFYVLPSYDSASYAFYSKTVD
jgi:hypothetical protein